MKIHKKHFSFLFLFLILPFVLNAQEIITSSGGYGSVTGAKVTWTVGETISETFSGPGVILTQGFNQGNIVITAIKEPEETRLNVIVFPNPASDLVTIFSSTPKTDNLRYILVDINGKILLNNQFLLPESQFPVSDLKPALYFLKIFDGKKELAVYKVVKK